MAEHEAVRTTDVETIRRWAEQRDGHPAVVERDGEPTELLRIDFGEQAERLKRISWEEFRDIFERNDLAMLYQERTKEDGMSRFFKFVDRE